MDSNAFRSALGQFATGVTIITTRTNDGKNVGLTANSFNSASLDPPMVLWSLARKSMNLKAFTDGQHFAVNILAADQMDLSTRFASPVEDRFENVDCELGVGGVPLLTGCAARFECQQVYCYEGGDHVIFVGEVLNFDHDEKEPLVYHRGGYAVAQPHQPEPSTTAASGATPMDEVGGGYVDDFLLPLLARCFRFVSRPFYEEGFPPDCDISIPEWRILSTISDQHFRTPHLAEVLLLKMDELTAHLGSLEQRGLIQPDDSGTGYKCTAHGSQRIVRLLAMQKASEADALSGFSLEQQRQLKQTLRDLIKHLYKRE